MNLSWSHSVLNVRDLGPILDFYTDVLGFEITDRGPIGGEEIVFLSQDPDEHHQLAMMNTRTDDDRSNSLNHLSFRTPDFVDLGRLFHRLHADGGRVLPLSHGNTLSLYFNDPEGNGIEVFWDTPWHVAQPQGEVWDTSMNESKALAWVEETFRQEPTFEPREVYYARRHGSE